LSKLSFYLHALVEMSACHLPPEPPPEPYK
jgi:hypothetical protein